MRELSALLKKMSWDPERVLLATFHALPLGVCITDPEGRFVYVNRAYCDTYGYEMEELLGRSFTMVVPKEDREEILAEHQRVIAGEDESLAPCWEVERKDGQRLSVSATAHVFTGDDGKRYKVTVVQDISDQVRAERMRIDAERVVRHDLKSPLNGVLGCVDLLCLDGELNETQQKHAKCIKNSGERMLHQLNHSMALAQMEEGTYQPALEAVEPGSVFEQISNEVWKIARKKKVELVTPEWPKDARVLGERGLMEEMLGNLVKNAIEASPECDVVTLECLVGEQRCVLSVHNSGAVPEAIRGRFFERYVSAKKGGTGLGTYAASLIARTLGGDINLSTSEAEGTRVTVELPLSVKQGGKTRGVIDASGRML
jgi:PAS domain S-box-containing protein